MPQKIVFFVQTTKPIGGSQVLFLDLASYIAKNYERDYEVYYINHANPLINELYGDANIHILDVNSCDYSQFDDAIFFTPFNYIFYLMAKIKHVKNARICLYFYHPQIMDWLQMQIGRKNANLNPLLQLLKQTDSYCFMDSSNYVALEKLTDVDFAKRYVPVAIHEEFQPYFSPVPYVNSDKLNIGWLGRLDRDKIYSLINLLDNLQALESSKPIDVHIIGDGNAKQLIKIANYAPQIRLVFTSYLYGEDRNNYIRENVDVMVAMGMSATDAGQLGIPTIVPIVSPTKFNDDKFIYLFNVKDYSLGWNREDIKVSGCEINSIEDVINDVYLDGRKTELGEKCFNYSSNTFSIELCAKSMLEVANMSTLTVKKCLTCRLIRRQLRIFKIYSTIRNRDDFASFHEFNARLKRIAQQPTLPRKIKRTISELKITVRRHHK